MAAAANNLGTLTKSHRAIASKKRARRAEVKEVLFDDEARREFLTGFHKRKLAVKEAKKEKRQLLEKQERLDNRKEHRRQLAERAKANAAEVEAAYGAIIDPSPSGSGSNAHEEEEEAEFEDDEHLATVTVVEDFDPDTLIHGPLPPPTNHDHTPPPNARKDDGRTTKETAPKPKSALKPKPKTRTKRYETKAGRKAERGKQHARKLEKAERAGGRDRTRTAGRGRGRGGKR